MTPFRLDRSSLRPVSAAALEEKFEEAGKLLKPGRKLRCSRAGVGLLSGARKRLVPRRPARQAESGEQTHTCSSGLTRANQAEGQDDWRGDDQWSIQASDSCRLKPVLPCALTKHTGVLALQLYPLRLLRLPAIKPRWRLHLLGAFSFACRSSSAQVCMHVRSTKWMFQNF